MGLFRKGNNVQYTPLGLVKQAVQVNSVIIERSYEVLKANRIS